MKKTWLLLLFTLSLCLSMLFVLSSQGEGMFVSEKTDGSQFDEIMELLSPYIAMNLESIAEKTGGVMPNRNSMTVYSEEGEYTIGRIGEYFGAVSILWKSEEYSIPLLRGAAIGMKRSEFERIFTLTADSNSSGKNIDTDNKVTFVADGDYLQTKITATINWFFLDDCLDRVELLLSAYGED